MNRPEQNAVSNIQAEIACLAALLRCVRVASESGQPQTVTESAMSCCEDVATAIADRMEDIPGLNSAPEKSA